MATVTAPTGGHRPWLADGEPSSWWITKDGSR